MIKLLNYFLQSICIYIFFLVSLILGLNLSRKLFANIFTLVAPLFKSKKIIKNNLKICFPNISQIEEEKIITSMWKNYGSTFTEYVFLNYFSKNNSHVSINDNENSLSFISKKKPVIFVSGHFANFELMSMEITKRKIPLATIYRPLNNIFLNPLMEYLRKKYVCKNQIKKGINGVRDAIGYIKKDHNIALMIDQRVSEGEKINFFQKVALTTTLPAQLSMKFNLDIVPVYIERRKSNKFYIEFQNRISPNSFKDKIELTKKLNLVLENMIKRNPYQWIWTHNRWKQ